jgi:hypothetical protein
LGSWEAEMVGGTEIRKKSIADYLSKLSKPSPWELGKEYFGKYASGQTNLSADRKLLLKKRILILAESKN